MTEGSQSCDGGRGGRGDCLVGKREKRLQGVGKPSQRAKGHSGDSVTTGDFADLFVFVCLSIL